MIIIWATAAAAATITTSVYYSESCGGAKNKELFAALQIGIKKLNLLFGDRKNKKQKLAIIK